MICPKCGCHDSHVIRTIRQEESTVRVRRCTACATLMETTETHSPSPAAKKSPKKKPAPRKKKAAEEQEPPAATGALAWAMGGES